MVRCPICITDNPPGTTTCRACGAALAGDPAGSYSSALRVGTALQGGEYTVGKVLGQGGFGITYLGGDTRAQRPVAIKEFFPQGAGRSGREVHPATMLLATDYTSGRDKFLEEARVLAQFHHPGIVDVYVAFEENNTAYMVMEYLRGKSLEGVLEERGLLPEREAVGYIVRVGEALQVIHAANMLHRDIKPGNVMLTDDGRVVLIDFGTARTYTAGKTGRMTTMVTPGYAPLEQYGQRVRFGPFTDVYALGATLYHLLTGHMPADATERVSGVVLKAPHELNPAVGEAVSRAVMWAMEIRVDARPQTVGELTAALQTGLAAPPTAPARVPVRTAPAPPSPPPTPTYTPPQSTNGAALPDEGPYDVTIRGELYWPQECACCGEAADSYYTVEHTGGDGPFYLFPETKTWDVPYCSQCLEHLEKTQKIQSPSLGRMVAGGVASLLFGPAAGILVGLGSSAMDAARHASELQDLLRPTCVAIGPAVAYLGWDGDLHAFRFASRPFTEAFLRENESVPA
jgi:serine/threonine protein kinase